MLVGLEGLGSVVRLDRLSLFFPGVQEAEIYKTMRGMDKVNDCGLFFPRSKLESMGLIESQTTTDAGILPQKYSTRGTW